MRYTSRVRAVTIADRRITVSEHPAPTPGRGELGIRVRAAGLNGADIIQVQGHYPAPPGVVPDIPGLELAGEVVTLGDGATRFHSGARVMALTAGGAQAQIAVVHESLAMPVPDGLDWHAAGGFPEAFITAHDALISQCELRSGERLLVNGAAGGVGTAAVQIGVAAGARVVASVRAPARRQAVSSLGAQVIDPQEIAEAGPYDVILELVGAVSFPANLRALATGGRISIIGVGAGARVELDLGQLMSRRGRLFGSTLRARPLGEKAIAVRRVEAEVLPLLEAGRLRVLVQDVFPLEAAADAYARFQAGAKLGKIVLSIG
ncbi:MAG: zinc-binding dehydrogenase [Candidatus Dormibacteria bacterium]|jgi:NADPH:quinone reductase-like Zn-dependent oxidoreductase